MKNILLIKLDPTDIPRAGDWAERACIAFGLDKAGSFQVKTCVVEAINNCVEHAFAKREGTIKMSIWENGRQINIEVIDEGKAPEHIGASFNEIDLSDPLAESGRGLDIIRSWMDEVTVQRDGLSNVLSMSKRIQH